MDDTQVAEKDQTSRDAEACSRHPNVDVSSSVGRGPRDECDEEGQREWRGSGPEMILRVLSIRFNVASEHRLGGNGDRSVDEDRPPVSDGRLNLHAVTIDVGPMTLQTSTPSWAASNPPVGELDVTADARDGDRDLARPVRPDDVQAGGEHDVQAVGRPRRELAE